MTPLCSGAAAFRCVFWGTKGSPHLKWEHIKEVLQLLGSEGSLVTMLNTRGVKMSSVTRGAFVSIHGPKKDLPYAKETFHPLIGNSG